MLKEKQDFKLSAMWFLIYILFYNISVAQSNSINKDSMVYKWKKLKKCRSDCAQYLTDTTSLIKTVTYNGKWVQLVHPLSEIQFDGKRYVFKNDLIVLSGQRVKTETFIPGNVDGYEISNSHKKYLVLAGGILGSTGISSTYSLVVIINLKHKVAGKYQTYGYIVKDFSINKIADFNSDGILEIKINSIEKIKLY